MNCLCLVFREVGCSLRLEILISPSCCGCVLVPRFIPCDVCGLPGPCSGLLCLRASQLLLTVCGQCSHGEEDRDSRRSTWETAAGPGWRARPEEAGSCEARAGTGPLGQGPTDGGREGRAFCHSREERKRFSSAVCLAGAHLRLCRVAEGPGEIRGAPSRNM